MPLQVEAAVDAMANGRVSEVDLAEADGHLFTNMASVGMSGVVAARVPHRLKRIVGRGAYPLTALAALPGHRPFDAYLECAGRTRHFRTRQINIANGAFHAGRPIARDAAIDNQLLVGYAIGGERRSQLLVSMTRMALSGHRRRMEDDRSVVGPGIVLRTDPPLPLDLDGELVGTTPTRISIAEAKLLTVINDRTA